VGTLVGVAPDVLVSVAPDALVGVAPGVLVEVADISAVAVGVITGVRDEKWVAAQIAGATRMRQARSGNTTFAAGTFMSASMPPFALPVAIAPEPEALADD